MSHTNTVTETNATLRISSKVEEDKKKCGKCGKAFKSKDKVVNCDTCSQAFHAKCQGVSDKKFELLKEEGDDTLWLCTTCNRTTRGLIQHVTHLEQKLTTLEVKVENKASKEEMEKLEKRVEAIEEKLDPETEVFAKKLEDALKEQQEIIQRNTVEKLKEARKTEDKDSSVLTPGVQQAVDEVKEQERRKSNIVMYNVPESESTNNDTRRQHDVAVIKELMKEELLIEADIKVDSRGVPMVRRLGKKTDGITRPLKITLITPEEQRKVLGKAKNLANSKNETRKKVIIKPDLTPLQRGAEKKLVEEKKARNEEAKNKKEEEDWVIYRGKLTRKSQIKTTKVTVSTSTGSLGEEYTDAGQD